MKCESTGSILGAIALAAGIALAGFFVSQTIYNSRVAVNTATVKGLAERKVTADLAVWDISFTMEANNLKDAYASADVKKKIVRDFLLDSDFSQDEFVFSSSVYIAEYRDEGVLKDKKYQVTTYVKIRSETVDKVQKLHQRVGDLIGKGVAIGNNAPNYLFTKLNDVKPDMLGEATQNARLAAKQFAEDAEAEVGGIQSAVQGNFSISAFDDTGAYNEDKTSLYKKVRVVTTVTFYLE